ncbi:hypothetical protein LCGC14_2765880 [marine sediment metagenome]|uniref:Response regulator n=2 Tax=root TaxID=1 RepID=A0A831QPH5_9FLAO|nr:response regulator [Pricia antarctica]
MIKRILLVDDDFDDADFFGHAVSFVGQPINFLHLESCAYLFKHLALNADYLPDLIFLDINMTIVNGFQCLQKLKISPEYRNITVLIYSTSSSDRDKGLAIEFGAAGFVTKPFELKTLIEILETIVSKDEYEKFLNFG